ncbi:MAG: superoxide dismutase, partial [Fusobacterium sp.]
MNTHYPFKLQPLNFDYSELEPCISKRTLEFHHDKHLLGYTNNLNKALENAPELQGHSLNYILSNLKKVPENIRTAITNNGGGVFNHVFYCFVHDYIHNNFLDFINIYCNSLEEQIA